VKIQNLKISVYLLLGLMACISNNNTIYLMQQDEKTYTLKTVNLHKKISDIYLYHIKGHRTKMGLYSFGLA